jgi:DNA-binding NarL/FixJ family response regulator
MSQLAAAAEPIPSDPSSGSGPIVPPDRPSSSPAFDLFLRIVGCELKIINHFLSDDRIHLVAEGSDHRPSTRERLTQRERDVLCRLLGGQAQKAIAYDLRISASTVATHATRALAKLNLSSDPYSVPLALVLIAQAASGAIALRDAKVTTSLEHGRRYALANLPRPPVTRLAKLTAAERAVALAMVDGLSKDEIARSRSTSTHTIGRQISLVFSKLGVRGRFDLIRRLSEPVD